MFVITFFKEFHLLHSCSFPDSTTGIVQEMAPAKQAKVIREFQKQSAQMDMTVRLSLKFLKP